MTPTCGVNGNIIIPEAEEVSSEVEPGTNEPSGHLADGKIWFQHLAWCNHAKKISKFPPGLPEVFNILNGPPIQIMIIRCGEG